MCYVVALVLLVTTTSSTWGAMCPETEDPSALLVCQSRSVANETANATAPTIRATTPSRFNNSATNTNTVSTANDNTVYVLHVFSHYDQEAALDVALNVLEAEYPQLSQQFRLRVVRKYSRNSTTELPVGDKFDALYTMRSIVRSLNFDNETYLYTMGPDGATEALTVSLMSPVYNMITLSGMTYSDGLNDIQAYPFHFSTCPRLRQLNVGQQMFVQILQFDAAALVTLDEPSLDRMRQVENLFRSVGIRIVASEVLSRESLDEAAKSLIYSDASIIASFSLDATGAQTICGLYKRGIRPENAVWIMGGPFYQINWWEPPPSSAGNGSDGWYCTRDEMLMAMNGSFAVGKYVEPADQLQTEVARRFDKRNNGQLLSAFSASYSKYLKLVNKTSIDTAMYYAYDTVAVGVFALYRAAEKYQQRFNESVATVKNYASDKYAAFARIMSAELVNTSFYGATGRLSITARTHSGRGVVQLTQFQVNSTQDAPRWIPISVVDFTQQSNVSWPERLVYGTSTGEPPSVIKARNALARRQMLIILVVCGGTLFLVIVALLAWFFIRRARNAAWQDVSWLVDETRLTKAQAVRSSLSSRVSMGDNMSVTSALTGNSFSRIDMHHVAVIDNSAQVWIRHLPPMQTPLSAIAPVKLNRVIFPQARAMFAATHDNMNKFYGFGNTGNKTQTHLNALYAFQSKRSLRRLLADTKLSVEQEMKLLFLADIVNGVLALHAMIGPHGFLHPDNLLLDERYTVKVTDYGLLHFQPLMSTMPVEAASEFVYDDNVMEKLVFRAPELLRAGYANAADQLVARADVYSMAMIFVEVMTRQVPFADLVEIKDDTTKALQNAEPEKMPKSILHDIIQVTEPPTRPALPPSSVSSALASLIKVCWQEHPQQRQTPAELLRSLKRMPGFRTGNVMQNLVKRLENFAQNLQLTVEERTRALAEEMQKTEQLLLQILPRSVAEELKKGNQVLPESFDLVSIYFSDIVGFASISAQSTPSQIVTLLNTVYTMFDSIIVRFDVYKVETIGDAYMVASGVPIRNGSRHAVELARMSMRLLTEIRTFEIPHRGGEGLNLRIGIHSGPCVAGVVGLKMPRYCLFGDTVNTASRMESFGAALRVHTSEAFYTTLTTEMPEKFTFELRGSLEVKGKGTMTTYWLLHENE